MFFLFSLVNSVIIYPFFIINLMVSIVIVIILSGISIIFIILSAFSGCSKYSMLGCIRIISQLISFELI
ncbi:MAG: NADH-quinone oxidoreductase subunit H [bacterium]|nr:NADH-quinone oxidoreductase subunit H [bacterium]